MFEIDSASAIPLVTQIVDGLKAQEARMGGDFSFSQLLLDKAAFPRHKACSDYLSPAAVRELRALGLLTALWIARPHPMQAMRVYAPGERVFLLMGRLPELYVALLGALKARCVVSPLFSAFGPEPIATRAT